MEDYVTSLTASTVKFDPEKFEIPRKNRLQKRGNEGRICFSCQKWHLNSSLFVRWHESA